MPPAAGLTSRKVDEMADAGSIFRWQKSSLVPVFDCDPVERSIEVADSFLIAEGSVLALDAHRRRFLTSSQRRGYHARADLEAFWDAAVEALPSEGSWFPRLELVRQSDGWSTRLLVRPSPVLFDTAILTTSSGPDARTAPDIKGPDLDLMLRIRQLAQKRGAQEAVILHDGYVVDASTSAILWWRDGGLRIPPHSFPRVESVTAAAIQAIAIALGITLVEEAATPQELDGCEVWVVNALHGIRRVTQWRDGPTLAEDAERASAWRSRLAALRRPVR